MSVKTWGTGRAFDVAELDMWLENTDVTVRSLLGGGQQTSGVPGAHWQAAMSFPQDSSSNRLELLAFFRSLNGKEHRIALWDLRKFSAAGVQGSPAGTINTTGVTVNTTAAQFASSVQLAGCGNTKTLSFGDMFSINGQLIECCELATSDAGGLMTVSVPQRLRATATAGAAVTLVKPTALFVLSAPFHGPRSSAFYEPFAIDLEEVFT